MAEGHMVLHWARELHALVGFPLQEIRLPRKWAEQSAGFVGRRLDNIETRGKNLLLHFSNHRSILCHAMRFGFWQIGARGAKLRKSRRHIRLLLRTHKHQAAFFHGPVVEVLTSRQLVTHRRLQALGPDLLRPDFDRKEVWRRLRRARQRPVGDALLDQEIVAGIGNIYKAEGLYLAGLDPRRPAGSITGKKINRLWDILVPLMKRGVETGQIITLAEHLRSNGGRTWVYRRKGRPCYRCGKPVAMVRQGESQRSTYFCPGCQK